MPAQIKVLGICLLIVAVFGAGLYAAISSDDSLDVASHDRVKGEVVELEKVEGMDIRVAGGRGNAGTDLGKFPGTWIATVELSNGEVVRVRAGNPPVSVGAVVDVNLTAFESGDLTGSLVKQFAD